MCFNRSLPCFDRSKVLRALTRNSRNGSRRVWIGSIAPGLIVPPLFFPTGTLVKMLGTMGNPQEQPRDDGT